MLCVILVLYSCLMGWHAGDTEQTVHIYNCALKCHFYYYHSCTHYHYHQHYHRPHLYIIINIVGISVVGIIIITSVIRLFTACVKTVAFKCNSTGGLSGLYCNFPSVKECPFELAVLGGYLFHVYAPVRRLIFCNSISTLRVMCSVK